MNIQCQHIDNPTNYIKSLQGYRVYKDQCVRCYKDATDQNGLFICMKCYNGFCIQDRNQHNQIHQHPLYINLIMTAKQSQQNYQITELAIGKQGGAVGGIQYQTNIKLYCHICQSNQIDKHKLLPQIQSFKQIDSPFKKQSLVVWELQIHPCEHSLLLEQIPINDCLDKCMQCDLSKNLWLCLTCGHTGCGRSNWDGTGGRNHGITHWEQSNHPLVVKLGTITAQGEASLYCYACNNDVKDENLKKHLEVLGINIHSQRKTEQTIVQMSLQMNLNFSLSRLVEDEKQVHYLYGGEYTGIQNLGNTCYMNSILQLFNNTNQIKEKYFLSGQEHLKKCKKIPADCYDCQNSKLFVGLNSGVYSEKKIRKKVINGVQVEEEYQRGIKPFDYKLMIAGKHQQFLSNRQQDALQYIQWVFDVMQKQKSSKDIPSLFTYDTTNRMRCKKCNCYKDRTNITNIWRIPILSPTQSDLKQYKIKLQNETAQRRQLKQNQDPQYKVSFLQCLKQYQLGGMVDLFCENCKKNQQFQSNHYFSSTPKYLLVVAGRFVVQKWVPKKLNAILDAPNKLDISEFLISSASEEGSKMVQQKKEEKNYSENNVAMLTSFGYSTNAAIRALIATHDNVEAACNYIIQNTHKNLDAPLSTQSQVIDEAAVSQVIQMGFQQIQARVALLKHKCSVPQAIEWLFSVSGDVSEFKHLLEPKQKKETVRQNKLNSNYELVGVVVHLGKSIHFGHYVAYMKKKGEWVLFNDDKVTLPKQTHLGKGYLYLYQSI